MSNLDILTTEIDRLRLEDISFNTTLLTISESIPTNIPFRFKLSISISESVLYSSQFRINILHWNESIIPVNSIMFIIAKSGSAKDSSLRYARKCFEPSYEKLNKVRIQEAVNKAINMATDHGDENPEEFYVYKKYYSHPNPLFSSISTNEGLIQHLNDLEISYLGGGFIYSGELGSELQSNPNIGDMLKTISELYDQGKKEVKLLKDKSNQNREIQCMPMSALFQTSQDMVIYDDQVRRRFKLEFSSKLARRSYFIFLSDEEPRKEYKSIQSMLDDEKNMEDKSLKSRKEVSSYLLNLTDRLLYSKTKLLKVKDEVRNLFIIYKKYNEELSNTINICYPITKLTRAHMQWKALKLSGAFAIMDGNSLIKEEYYLQAMKYVELISEDILTFEKELQKENHELCADYIKTNSSISYHMLKKLNFITGRTQLESQKNELLKLMNSYDTTGVYEDNKDTITYKPLKKKDTILISYVECKGTKEERKKNCYKGFICEEYPFSSLSELLKGDYAYSPFRFKDGIRKDINIDSPCKWIVFDIDDTDISDYECHILLSDLNHFIARTSNPENQYKYRVLLELDSDVDISSNLWSKFTSSIASDLGLKIDHTPKSQIFFSYSGREIYSILGASTLEAHKYIVHENEFPSRGKPSDLLSNPIDTFSRAFNARDGEGKRKIIWACKYARELGASKDYCLALISQINDYWVSQLPQKELELILNQVRRWKF